MKISEEIDEQINGLANQVDWESVSKSADKDRVIKAFADKIKSAAQDSEKTAAEQAAKSEAEARCMQVGMDNGATTADKELEKYLNKKTQAIHEAENSVSVSLGGKPIIDPLNSQG